MALLALPLVVLALVRLCRLLRGRDAALLLLLAAPAGLFGACGEACRGAGRCAEGARRAPLFRVRQRA